MTEYDHEPVRGLPGELPAGEHIIWQGSPEWRTFARSALHTRWVSAYFAALAVLGLASGKLIGAAAAVIGGAITLGLLALFAVLVARTTVYTITNRRVVLRVGIALNKCINLPLALIGAANMRELGAGHGEIALVLTGSHRLGLATIWPHARPWHLSKPQPMLRALPDAQAVAKVLAQACAAVVPNAAPAAQRSNVAPATAPVRDHGMQGAMA
ncbi:MAG: photosynthetic complex assembly protein [Novosphingobium sp. 28-62-57]|uniref:photosynthetic complex putative assembly protein PuhB n=1 Tax=unclassified Novosphingobium TaxID=2644732 RepID=UPI000BCC1672|nr:MULTISPECIES: photosynthetic complex putative assembly protein PuhB [unclassified Novosphingobium]OYW49403.1 MAG: photosynthetic complex assembly protein [Novosphingobium sp. 12-62-10]OYZ09155.1 MAG: photosynthetic complex assembly protein [Novosphingobium sp. 28-62-57]OZA32979.1 MAG: photosynthetic complex assembly protein [Novosphingobium sp. 17-62-9]HQS68345.1 photosynthetic complex putative assembly protein PuhB [Novosphingobium sp.]